MERQKDPKGKDFGIVPTKLLSRASRGISGRESFVNGGEVRGPRSSFHVVTLFLRGERWNTPGPVQRLGETRNKGKDFYSLTTDGSEGGPHLYFREPVGASRCLYG